MTALRLGYVGGLGLMAAPAARHLGPEAGAVVARVHDRGTPGERRDAVRAQWQAHGAALLPRIEDVVGDGDLDAVVICCGKNGDDLEVVARVAAGLQGSPRAPVVVHLSTVSVGFVTAAHAFCTRRGVGYVNYPLTGGPLGAERGGSHPGGMLILASGDREIYARLEPTLQALGHPRHLGDRPESGAETKLIGQHMVFNGCTGIGAAAALHAECFAAGTLGGPEQTAFFDFLNGGAGGTRQWEVALGKGVRDGIWDSGFLVPHAVVDAIYAAQLAREKGLPRIAIQPVLTLAFGFAYLLEAHPGAQLATHAVTRELLASRAGALDAFLVRHGAWAPDVDAALAGCVRALPASVRDTVQADVAVLDFEQSADVSDG